MRSLHVCLGNLTSTTLRAGLILLFVTAHWCAEPGFHRPDPTSSGSSSFRRLPTANGFSSYWRSIRHYPDT
ncbi:hypothetical protein B0H16DRAFT_1537554 [Mycena metata]|uniref:Secreted protein n=1 Tax=Mycena metata TaxID=1033252 RepID=A0AAD7J4T0_9AGAR|nr:hypothetical protein B0H16DRAFT_1537554 [Mycena metata]